MVPFISLFGIPKHVVGITKHVVTTISAFSFTMLLLDRILTHIVNHLSNTSYHLQYLYCQGGYVYGAKPNLITCVAYIFLSVFVTKKGREFEKEGKKFKIYFCYDSNAGNQNNFETNAEPTHWFIHYSDYDVFFKNLVSCELFQKVLILAMAKLR